MATKKEQLLELLSDTNVQEYIAKKERINAINLQIDNLRAEKDELLSSIKPSEDNVKVKIADVIDGTVKAVEPVLEQPVAEEIITP